MPYTAELFTSSVVALGDFNPAIFTPDWMERNELLGAEDAGQARDSAILLPRQFASCETKWFVLQVAEDKFSLTSKDALTPALKDLAVGILQLVPHTPIKAIGINFMGHFRMPDRASYHRVGDSLAPKDIWSKIFPDSSAGLADLTIKISPGDRDNVPTSADEKRITVQPSTQIKMGVFLSYNDHRDLKTTDESDLRPAERAASILDSDWDAAWNEANRVFDLLLTESLR